VGRDVAGSEDATTFVKESVLFVKIERVLVSQRHRNEYHIDSEDREFFFMVSTHLLQY
jgi:fructose-1-phosphate kinase PfkB-like protein